MKLIQTQKQSLTMTTALQQSLHILHLSLPELQAHINDVVMENPLVDLNQYTSTSASAAFSSAAPLRICVPTAPEDEHVPEVADPAQQETFLSHLKQQLPQVARYLPERFLPICEFILESLDRRGYLDEPLDLIAASMGVSLEDATQALYAVQSLTPTGVGARTLEECLVLQLAESPHFNQYTLALVQQHLELLARRDFAQIASLLGISISQAKEYFDLIRSLNPIPSNGFRSVQDENHYIVPEAYVDTEGGVLSVRMDMTTLSIPSVNEEYVAALSEAGDREAQNYIRDKYRQIRELQGDIDRRFNTISRVINVMVSAQRDYLLNHSPAPAPLSVQELAEQLDLHPSTVSRAIQDKYISVSGHVIPLKSLLCAQIGSGIPISGPMLKIYMDKLIAAEDKAHPLSDEALCAALSTMGVNISRRTVADYRKEFEIPAASKRKKK